MDYSKSYRTNYHTIKLTFGKISKLIIIFIALSNCYKKNITDIPLTKKFDLKINKELLDNLLVLSFKKLNS